MEEDRLRALDDLRIVDTPPEERFDRVTRLAQRLFRVPVALVTLLDRDRQWFKSSQGIDLTDGPRTDSFCSATIYQPDTLVINDLAADDRCRSNPYVTGPSQFRFYAGHPLEAPGGQRVGTLCILDRTPRELSTHDRQLLRELAEWVQKELAHDEEFERAAHVQRALLPAAAPAVAGYELAATCLPNRAVGGDFYDWYLANGELAVTVADVMGKGFGAAIMMASVRATMRAAARSGVPAATVREAAGLLHDELEESALLVTLMHARLQPGAGLLRYADAGHGLAVLVRANGATDRLSGNDLPLGAFGDAWSEAAVTLEHGDVLVVFSDGVLDLFDGTFASLDRVAEVVRSTTSAHEVVDRLRAMTTRSNPPDDVTAVVIKRKCD